MAALDFGAYEETVDRLCRRLRKLRFSAPVTHVYNPLEYARAPHMEYVRRHAVRGPRAVLLGMNPGPWGMAQTGVPFGEVAMVRDWLGITGAVARPKNEHAARPIEGFSCARSEVSGARLWGFARDRFVTPPRFFATFFVVNYCPLVFMETSGKNFTPDKLRASEREPLIAACDEALREIVSLVGPEWVIGVGQFAEDRAKAALGDGAFRYGRILHPSPASPAANKDWSGSVTKTLAGYGLL
ncbi:MAG: single-stranded DNA-binding protein [Deltaproteobacteria bacterium]|nr:single-stranded DNA-binding protein [Deltaproteobacteria bacterium]